MCRMAVCPAERLTCEAKTGIMIVIGGKTQMDENLMEMYALPFVQRHLLRNRRERVALLLRRGSDHAWDALRSNPSAVLRPESRHGCAFSLEKADRAVQAMRERGAGETVCVVDLFHGDMCEMPLEEGVLEVLAGLSRMAVSPDGRVALVKPEVYTDQYLVY